MFDEYKLKLVNVILIQYEFKKIPKIQKPMYERLKKYEQKLKSRIILNKLR